MLIKIKLKSITFVVLVAAVMFLISGCSDDTKSLYARGYALQEIGYQITTPEVVYTSEVDEEVSTVNEVRTGGTPAYVVCRHTSERVWSADSGDYRIHSPKEAPMGIFTGKKPIFEGALTIVTYYDEGESGWSADFEVSVLQAFKKSDLKKRDIRIGYDNFRFQLPNIPEELQDQDNGEKEFIFDLETVKSYIVWEDEDYIFCDWYTLFTGEDFVLWLTGAIPMKDELDDFQWIHGYAYPTEELMAACRAAKENFDAKFTLSAD